MADFQFSPSGQLLSTPAGPVERAPVPTATPTPTASQVWKQPDFQAAVTGNQQQGSTPALADWNTYTVQPGDSWEKIAGTVYGDQRMYEVLQRANNDHYGDLQPGQSILLTPSVTNPYVSGLGREQFARQNPITPPAGTVINPLNPLTVGTDSTTKAPAYDTTAPIAAPQPLDASKFSSGQAMYYDTKSGEIVATAGASTSPLYWDETNQKLTLDPAAGKAAVFDQTFPYTALSKAAFIAGAPSQAFRMADEEATYNDYRTFLDQNPEVARGWTVPLTADDIAKMSANYDKWKVAQAQAQPTVTQGVGPRPGMGPRSGFNLMIQTPGAMPTVGGSFTVTNLQGTQQKVGPTPWYQAVQDWTLGMTSRITEAVLGVPAVANAPSGVTIDLASAVTEIQKMASDPVKYFSPLQGAGPVQQTLHQYGQYLKLAGVKEMTVGDTVVGVLASANYVVGLCKYAWAFQSASMSQVRAGGLINDKLWIDPATNKFLTHNEAVQMKRDGKNVQMFNPGQVALIQAQSDFEKAQALLKYTNIQITGGQGKLWPGTGTPPIKPDFTYQPNTVLGKDGTPLAHVYSSTGKDVTSVAANRTALIATRDHLRNTAYPLITQAQAIDQQIAANPGNTDPALTTQRDALMAQAKSQITQAQKIDEQTDMAGGFNKYFNYGIDLFPDRKAAFDTALTEAEMQKGAPLSFEEISRIQDVFSDPTTEMAGRVVFDPIWLAPQKVWDVAFTPVKAVLGVGLDVLKAAPFVPAAAIDMPIMAVQAILGHDPEGFFVPALHDIGEALSKQAIESVGRATFDMMKNAVENIAGGSQGTREAFEKNIGDFVKASEGGSKVELSAALTGRDGENLQRVLDRTGIAPAELPTVIARAQDTALERISNFEKARLMRTGLTGAEAEGEALRIAQDAVEHPAKMSAYIADEIRSTYMKANMLTPNVSKDSILGALAEKFGWMDNPRSRSLLQSAGTISHFVTRAWQDTVTVLRPAWAFYHTIDSVFRSVVFGEGPFGDLGSMLQWLHPDFSGLDELVYTPAEMMQALGGESGANFARELVNNPDEYKYGPLGFIKRQWELKGMVGEPTDHLVSNNSLWKNIYDGIGRGVGSMSQGMRDYNGALQFALRTRLYYSGLSRDMMEMGSKEIPRLLAQFADRLPDEQMASVIREAGNNPQRIEQLTTSLNRMVKTDKGMVPAWHVLFPPNFDAKLAFLPPEQAAIFTRNVTKGLSDFFGKIEQSGRAVVEGDVHVAFDSIRQPLIADATARSENIAGDGLEELDRNVPATQEEIAAKQPSLSQDKPDGTVKFQKFQGEITPVQDVNTGLHNLAVTKPFQRTTEVVQNFADAAGPKHIVTDAGSIVTEQPFSRIVVDRGATVPASVIKGADNVMEIHLSDTALNLPKTEMRALLQDQVGLVLRETDEGALKTAGIAKEDYPALFKQFLDHPEALRDENPAAFRLLNEQMSRNQRAQFLLEGLRNQRIETHFISPALSKAIESADPGAEVKAIIADEVKATGHAVPADYAKSGDNFASTVGKTFDQVRARAQVATGDAEVAASTKALAHYNLAYDSIQRLNSNVADWLRTEPAWGPIGPANLHGVELERAWDWYRSIRGAIWDSEADVMRNLGTKISTMTEDEIDKLPQISAKEIFDNATVRVGGVDHPIFRITTGHDGGITEIKVFNPRGAALYRTINDPARLKAFSSSLHVYDAKSLAAPWSELIDRPVQEVVKNAISTAPLTEEESQAFRVQWTRQLQQSFNLTDDQAVAVRSMIDLHANQWAKAQQAIGNDVTPAMWYSTHLFGVTSGPVQLSPDWLAQLGKTEFEMPADQAARAARIGEIQADAARSAGLTTKAPTDIAERLAWQDKVQAAMSDAQRAELSALSGAEVPYGMGGLIGQTKIVDANGLPVEYYHGTRANFDEFELGRANPNGGRGAGIYFTDSSSHAEAYANLAHARTEDTFKTWQDATDFANANSSKWDQIGGQFRIEQRGDSFVVVHPVDTAANVRRVYIDARNPFDARTMTLTPEQLKQIGWDTKLGAESGDVEKILYSNPGLQADLPRAMQQLKYDGYVYPISLADGSAASRVVLWNPKQIVPAQYASADGAFRQMLDASRSSPKLQKGLSDLMQKGVEGEGQVRGATTFLDDGRSFIKAFQSSDMTTLIHELGHIFRRDLPAEDMKIAEDFVSSATGKAVENGVWARGHEEAFAQAFEKYIGTGEVPTPALKTTFEHLRDWFVMAYKSFIGDQGPEFDLAKIHPDIQLSPEMKGVYGRMFADTQSAAALDLEKALATPIDEGTRVLATVTNGWRNYGTNLLTGEGMLTDDSLKLIADAVGKNDLSGLATADLREESEGVAQGVKVSAERRQEIIDLVQNKIVPEAEHDAKVANVRQILTSNFTNPTDPTAHLAIRQAGLDLSKELSDGTRGYRYTTPAGEWGGVGSTYPQWYKDMWVDPDMKYVVNKSYYVKDAQGLVHKMGVLGKTQRELDHIAQGENVESAIGQWLKSHIVDRLLNPEGETSASLEAVTDPYVAHLLGDDSILTKYGLTPETYADSVKGTLEADAAKTQAFQLKLQAGEIPFIDGVTDPAVYRATLADAQEAALQQGATGDANALEAVNAKVDQLQRAADPTQGFISAPALPEGTKQYLATAGNRAVANMQLQEALDNWEEFLSGQVRNGDWTLQPKTAEELQAWKEFGQQAAASKQNMLDVANYGGTFGGKTYQGSVPYVNSKMLNYTNYSVFDKNMKSVMPFWMFPSRTIPMWMESIATHPEIGAFYDKYLQTSRRIALQDGAVTSTGQQLPSLEGYIPLPGSDGLWINPMAAFSFRLVFPHRDANDAQEAPPGVMSTVYAYLRDMGSYFGFTFGPWVTLPAMAMSKDPTLIAPSLVPQADLVPAWTQRSILEEIRRITGINMPDTWTPQVTWKDYLVERRLLSDANVYLKSSNLSQADKIAYVAKVQNSLKAREGDPLWDSAQRKEETGDYWRRFMQFFTGIQAKPYSDAEAEFQSVRNDINTQRSAINDEVLANMLPLYGDPVARYAQYNTERYNTDQGALISDYGIISHTTDPTTGQQLYGQPRRDLINTQLDQEAATSSYFNALDANHAWLTDALTKLPIGAGADQTDPVWTQYFNEQQKIENDPAYANATRVWAEGYKPDSMTKDHFASLWWNMIRGTRPTYTPETGQTYPQYQGNMAAWEASLPMMAQNLYQSFITQNEGVIGKAQGIANTNALNVSPSVQAATPTTDIMKFLLNLAQTTSATSYNAWQNSQDTAYDAINKAWQTMYWDPYWAMLGGKTGYEYDAASQQFKEQHPTPPTADQITAWVNTNYPNQFAPDVLSLAINGRPEETITTREAPKTADAALGDEVWNILMMAGPSKTALMNQYTKIAKYPDGWNTWYTSGGNPAAWKDPAEFEKFVLDLKQAAMNLNLQQPDTARLEEMGQAQNLNAQWNQIAQDKFGANIQDLIAARAGLSTSAEKKAFDVQNPQVKEYYTARDQWAVQNPVWAKYYQATPSATTAAKTFTSSGYKYTYKSKGGGKAKAAAAPKFTTATEAKEVPRLAYRDLTTHDTLDLAKIGKGGVGGLPTALAATVGSEALDEIAKSIEGGGPLTQATLDYLNAIAARHPDWQSIIDNIVSVTKANQVVPQNT